MNAPLRKSGFLQFLPSHCFETYSVKFYGKEKLTAKILSVYMIELDENSQNYPWMKVRVKWSDLVSSSVSLPEILCYVNI